MAKRNYPKNRKKRNVSYSKSYKLLQEYGEERLKVLFQKHGMYTSSKIISNELGKDFSPYVIRHCRKRYNLGGINEKVAA
jgi:predicted AlkP superfamily pyrophosphatase or phosphodiesterase